jgi:A/G-specific adenine glycosylase
MLQQIQVKRAIPFYEAFVERFPTPASLAEAPVAEAIRVWGDLGRYRRVANLHRTARILVEEHGGEVPADPEVLVGLPGIGPYTAGAVACFAFERPAAFVDTNVRRVLHRMFLGAEVPEPAVPDGEVLALAKGLVPEDGADAWEWNQALIELGALVCTARRPLCEACPVRNRCEARPVIRGALAGLSGAEGGAVRFEGSNRYYRGRVLAALRDSPGGRVALRELRGGPDGDDALLRLQSAARSLQRDGLAVVEDDALPEAGAAAGTVAEERTPYDAGSPGEAGRGMFVRLP